MSAFEIAVINKVGNGLAYDPAYLKILYTPSALLELSEIYGKEHQERAPCVSDMLDILTNDYIPVIVEQQDRLIECDCPVETDPYGTGDKWLRVCDHSCHEKFINQSVKAALK